MAKKYCIHECQNIYLVIGVTINYVKTVELHDGHSNLFDFQNRLVLEFKLDDFTVSLCYDNTNQFAINIDSN